MSVQSKTKEKIKFYQLTKLEQEAGQIQSIYKKIDEQGKYMEDLLAKYNGLETEILSAKNLETEQERSRTLDVKSQRSSILSQRSKFEDRNELLALELPYIKKGFSSVTKNSEKVSKIQHKDRRMSPKDNLQLSKIKNLEDREKLKKNLQQAYFGDKAQINFTNKNKQEISNSKHQNSEEKDVVNKSIITEYKKGKFIFDNKSLQEKNQEQFLSRRSPKLQKTIPEPLGLDLGYFVKRQYSESSSEQGEVPLAYYQKEYRGMIRAQCLQETNFLYFSKNESMHNWTEGLLLLFEKHDKELASLRKRCKYLQKFDNTFFSIDIFKND